jgi:pimeloyl-ACP methyl ester carboxylesterase
VALLSFHADPIALASTRLLGVVRGSTVDIVRFDVARGEIVKSQMTWIVIHGWNSSRTEPNITDLASAITFIRPTDQVLTLDWSSIADSGLFACDAAAGIVPVASWAATVLSSYGFATANLNLIGHSFGAYVADETARRLPSKVNSLVALDPAANVCPGTFNPVANGEIDFARHAAWSWAFHASSAGNEYVPVRAHEAFIVDSGLSIADAHSRVVLLFAYMISHQLDPLSRLFGLQALLDDRYGPWALDVYSSYFWLDDAVRGYEAIIVDPDGVHPTRVWYFPNGPSLSVSLDVRTIHTPYVVVRCSATDAGHGENGISGLTIDGWRFSQDTAMGGNAATGVAKAWLRPGTNSLYVVAADNGVQKAYSTNVVTAIYAPSAVTYPWSQIARSGRTGHVDVAVSGPPNATIKIESSADLIHWQQAATGRLLPTVTYRNSGGLTFGEYFGTTTLTFPTQAPDGTRSGFYRATYR